MLAFEKLNKEVLQFIELIRILESDAEYSYKKEELKAYKNLGFISEDVAIILAVEYL